MKGEKTIYAVIWRVWLILALTLWVTQSHARLIDVRTGHSAEATRVVLDLSERTDFQVFPLYKPNRVVVRLKNAGRHLPFTRQILKDKRIKRIRIGRNKRDLIVVFDLKGDKRFKYFALGPKGRGVAQRLVVDIVEPAAVARKTSARAPARKLAKRTSLKPVVKRVASHKPAKTVSRADKKTPLVRKPVKKTKTVAHNAKKYTVNKKQPARLTAEQKQLQEEILKYTRRPLDDRKVIVAIDAGHGGKDTGAIGVGGVKEKDLTLALARQLKREIDKLPNMRAVLIRDGDYFISLNERPRIAKEKNADLFISLHADAFPDDRSVRGGSIYVLNERGATTALNRALERSENGSLFVHAQQSPKKVAYILGDLTRKANLQASRGLAKTILKQLARKVRMHKLSVQSANFAVLRQLDMPSILVETAFISNPHDVANLRSRRFQQRFAAALAQGIAIYARNRADQPHWGETLFVKYRVRSGDTLSEIAQRFGTDVRTLKRLNRIKRADRLYAGMRLRVPLKDKVVAALN
ncbi:N-acetylmuramoyl-L-alanine amidase [Sulfurivirga caldicuralii]|uniref:N-acetylmuramoyl-L-alanine amidase n=1 Tax=Sulfurivirga caldicuralii TaxID=364032 RepID=A0A1N6F2Z3_9GAMM|nr:N-acetylmuramoyl-L-alanine amidase [Sulfurivirga caldicuralii]SIN89658.1 N-acetylmuramoyl-L-alanine amidase [Sulfurivirga caldicuralii]